MDDDATPDRAAPPAAGRAPGRGRATLLRAAAWLAATAVAGAVAWSAVTTVGGPPSDDVLAAGEVEALLARERAAAPTDGPVQPTTAPTTAPSEPTVDPGASTPPPDEPAPPAVVARSWPVPGGTVDASCAGATITLVGATPADGWAVEVKEGGPAELEVEFRAEDDRTRVRAVCTDGVPTQVDGDDDDADTDDDGDDDASTDG